MNLLICAQTLDKNDPTLGFFHRWVELLATRFEHIEVICLGSGSYQLPQNVLVHSLGKERGEKRSIVFAFQFIREIIRLRKKYDAVLVHQGQEFVIVGGSIWKVLGKKIFLWRNHYKGSLRTRLAGIFCTSVFYTSRSSYTARFKNGVKMPIGVALPHVLGEVRTRGSILSLGRIAPSKRVDVLIEALARLREKNITFKATIAGPFENKVYEAELRSRIAQENLTDNVLFPGALTHTEAARAFASHDVFVNMSPKGMYDKTIFEAAASGCLVLSSIDDFKLDAGDEYYFRFGDASELSEKIAQFLALSPVARNEKVTHLQDIAKKQDLATLIDRLSSVISRRYREKTKVL